MQPPIKRGLKHLQGAVWAVCLASAGGALADPQKVTVYTNTNAVDFDPANATLVLETKVTHRIDLPFAGWKDVWGPVCVQGAPAADCTAAKDIYNHVQDVTDTLGDKQLGPGGTQPVIMMKNHHPHRWGGLYDAVDKAIIVYPSPGGDAATVAHEMAHVYVAKHVGTQTCGSCTAATIESWGVRLVFAAYKKVVARVGKSVALDIYRTALLRLKGQTVTLATLHEKVGDIIEERYSRVIAIGLPILPESFVLVLWDAWVQIYWVWVC